MVVKIPKNGGSQLESLAASSLGMDCCSAAFTLVELLIVIAIIGILAAVVIAVINPAARFRSSRDTLRQHHLGEIIRAVEGYRAEYGKYPESQADLTSGENSYIRNWPTDPAFPNGSPSAYSFSRHPDEDRFCVDVNEETHDARFIRWDSAVGIFEPNSAGCDY